MGENDVERCAQVVADAFKGDPLYLHAMRSDDEKLQFSRFLVRKSLLLDETGIVAENEGDIIGVASVERDSGKALLRMASMMKWRFLKEAIALKKAITAEGFRFFNQYMRFTTSVRPKGVHHYLVFIGVSPASQGRGIGSGMLRFVHRIVDADETSLGVGLDTENEANVRYYERFGYKVVAVKKVGEVVVYAMFRRRKS